jgi:hypothetical protein
MPVFLGERRYIVDFLREFGGILASLLTTGLDKVVQKAGESKKVLKCIPPSVSEILNFRFLQSDERMRTPMRSLGRVTSAVLAVPTG